MSTSSRAFVRRVVAAVVVASAFAASAWIVAPRASSSEPPLERELRAAYPHGEVPTGGFAGVDLGRLSLPGLQLVAREDHAVDEGGIVLSFADEAGTVRAVVTVAVAPDAASARRFVDVALHGVAAPLDPADPALGDFAFADDRGRGDAIVVGAAANVAWVVRSLRDDAAGLPSAREIVTALRARVVEGAPTFPEVELHLPSVVDAKLGADVRVRAATRPRLRAEGAYVAHGKGSPRVKPFGPGPIAVIAVATDELGRVTEVRATATAK